MRLANMWYDAAIERCVQNFAGETYNKLRETPRCVVDTILKYNLKK